MKLASSEAKKTTKLATSSGLPNRPKEVNLKTACLTSWGTASVSFDSINPGATALTLTPNLPTSLAKDLVKPIMPALAAA